MVIFGCEWLWRWQVFEDVTVLNSPDWSTHFSSVEHLRVRRINVTQPGGGNRDGIDIDSCQDVVVENSFIASGACVSQ